MMKELEIKLFGKVQGVSLRQLIKKEAEELGLAGYVQNLDTGSVEILAQGEKESLEQFVETIKEGTMFSKIDECKVVWHEQPQDSFTEFEIWI